MLAAANSAARIIVLIPPDSVIAGILPIVNAVGVILKNPATPAAIKEASTHGTKAA